MVKSAKTKACRNATSVPRAMKIAGTAIAFIWANVDLESYDSFVNATLFSAAEHVEGGDGEAAAGSHGPSSVKDFVNHILMCFFFALATKEIWESLLPGGHLSTPRKAAMPLVATAGGIFGPALLFYAGCVAFERPELVRGWAIPCATDIAFSYLIARYVFGIGHPAIPFLLLVAVADDAVGLIILATVYPDEGGSVGIFLGCLAAAKKWNSPTFRCLGVVKTPNAYNGSSDGHFPRLELSIRQNLTGR